MANTSVVVGETAGSAASPRRRRLSGRPRTAVRAVHVVVSVGWFGLTVAMVVLGLYVLARPDPQVLVAAYSIMDRLAGRVIPVFAVLAVLSGVGLSLTTPWGLVRHWWVAAKIVLTGAVIGTGINLTGPWLEQGLAAARAAATGAAAGAGWLLVATSAAHAGMLAAATAISVMKPWGRLRAGRLRLRPSVRD